MSIQNHLRIILIFSTLLLGGCGNSVKEVLKEDHQLTGFEILYNIQTEYGNVVFLENGNGVYHAKLLRKERLNWKRILGSRMAGGQSYIDWGVLTKEGEPAFFYGVIQNNDIEEISINGEKADIVESENGDPFFYLLTEERMVQNLKNGEEGIQIKGYSDNGKLIYQRLTFD